MKVLLKTLLIPLLLIALMGGCSNLKTTSEPAQECLKSALTYSIEKSGNALVVWADGEILLEDYQHGYDSEKPHTLTEISTLLISLSVLAAEDEAVLSLDDPEKSDISISQLLYAVSGLEKGSHRVSGSFKNTAQASLEYLSGEKFQYGPASYQVLGELLLQRAGSSFLKNRILEPLDIPGERWAVVSDTNIDPGTGRTELEARYFDGAHLTARELINIGKFIVRDGKWNNDVLISDLLNRLAKPFDITPGFGLSVWLNTEIDQDYKTKFYDRIPEEILYLWGGQKLIYDKGPKD